MLAVNLFLVLGAISLMTFRDYQFKMQRILQEYEELVEKEFPKQKETHPMQKQEIAKNIEKNKFLSDPTK
jgi:hypothetical protein